VVAEHRKRGWKQQPRVEVGTYPTESSTRG
jgi:hypothetical protein